MHKTAKMPSRHCVSTAISTRTAPELAVISKGEAISHNVQFEASTGALGVPLSASIAHLKVNGTVSVASLAISSSTIDQTTRIFRSARSPGQI